MAPVMVPIVQLNEDGVVDVNVRFVFEPEQILKVGALVTTGPGFTVTVRTKVSPKQPLADDLGVIKYSTVPAVALPGLVKIWFMVLPEPAEAPVIPPVMVPIVHWNALGIVAIRFKLVDVPLQIDLVDALVTCGSGSIASLTRKGSPLHPRLLTPCTS
jgi:hypothetical protein